MSRISNMDVLSKMVERNLDIRISVLPENLVGVKRVAAGGHATIGVDSNTANILMAVGLGTRTHRGFLCIFNNQQFDEIKSEMEHEIKANAPLVSPPLEALERFDPNLPGARMHAINKLLRSPIGRPCATCGHGSKRHIKGSENGDHACLDCECKDWELANVSENDYDKSIHSNPDADAWARFYCQNFPDADLDIMRGWFANAMMAMYDHIKSQEKHPTTEEISDHVNEASGVLDLPVTKPVSMWPESCSTCDKELKEIIGCPTCPNYKKE